MEVLGSGTFLFLFLEPFASFDCIPGQRKLAMDRHRYRRCVHSRSNRVLRPALASPENPAPAPGPTSLMSRKCVSKQIKI